ncbi:hypothetical protein CspeluHIS016_0310030 [Cutaneotrichosporon spelunceum]|uniref:NAD(P)-binding protein n=1 Tax=Cutaneotrichosporon spelunceum TaxID=1672016 RepID=A0AAD3TUL0_9TREE|nr:hypothetical protein CspeluHIS016_0310030 [Cutaneotrichosporon spelunceum]
MSFDVAAAVASAHLTTPKTAVLVGATTGIGAATARTFSSVGVARIIVVGRDAERGEQVLAACRAAAAGADGIQGDLGTRFVPADLSTRAGALLCARDLATESPIHYLIMCQNGVPRIPLQLNEDGDVSSFAVQALSRFLLPQALISAGALPPDAVVISVANVGKTLAGLSVDDLSLKSMSARTNLGAWMAQSARDSCVLDGFITEQIARYPSIKWFHVFPGLVASERFQYDAFPFPMNWLIRPLMYTPMAKSTQSLANLVVYIALEPDKTAEAAGNFVGPSMNALKPGAWASDPANRAALWTKLEAMAA